MCARLSNRRDAGRWPERAPAVRRGTLGRANGQLNRPRGRSIPAGFVAPRSLADCQAPSSRLAIRAPPPRSSIDFSIRWASLAVLAREVFELLAHQGAALAVDDLARVGEGAVDGG